MEENKNEILKQEKSGIAIENKDKIGEIKTEKIEPSKEKETQNIEEKKEQIKIENSQKSESTEKKNNGINKEKQTENSEIKEEKSFNENEKKELEELKIKRRKEREHRRKKARTVVALLIVVSLIFVAIPIYQYYIFSQQDVPILKVKVSVRGNLSQPIIYDIQIDWETVKANKEPKNQQVKKFPALTVYVYKDLQGYFSPINYYSIVGFIPETGKGENFQNYTLTVSFSEKPSFGQELYVQAKIVNEKGKDIENFGYKYITLKYGYVSSNKVIVNVNGTNETPNIANFTVSQDWILPNETAKDKISALPLISIEIFKNGKKINYNTSIAFNRTGKYEFYTDFKEKPIVNELLEFSVKIKNSDGNILAEKNQSTKTWFRGYGV